MFDSSYAYLIISSFISYFYFSLSSVKAYYLGESFLVEVEVEEEGVEDIDKSKTKIR